MLTTLAILTKFFVQNIENEVEFVVEEKVNQSEKERGCC